MPGSDFEQARAHDDDRDQRGGDRKQREPPRPDRELGIRFVGEAAACHVVQASPASSIRNVHRDQLAQMRFKALHSAASSSVAPPLCGGAMALMRGHPVGVAGWSRKIEPGSWLARDPVQEPAEGAGIGLQRLHGAHRESVGGGFRPRANRPISAATRLASTTAPPPTKSPSSMPNTKRQPGRLEDGAGAVAIGDMAELVGDHARDLVHVLGLVDQSLEHIDVAAGQRDGIGFRAGASPRTAAEAQPPRPPTAGPSACRTPPCRPVPPARRRIRTAGRLRALVEHRAHLGIGGVAEALLDRLRHQPAPAGRRCAGTP